MKNITVREWIEKFNHGEFDNEDFKTQCAAGWYDWFCSTKTLAKKLKKMGNIIKDIKNDYILDNFRVWFKNNCPCSYPLYDDFRFEPIKENKEDADDDVRDQLYFGVQCGHPYGSDYMYEIFSVYETLLNRLLEEVKNEDIKKGINIALSAYMDSGYMNYNDMYNDELMSETVDGYLQTLGEKGV